MKATDSIVSFMNSSFILVFDVIQYTLALIITILIYFISDLCVLLLSLWFVHFYEKLFMINFSSSKAVILRSSIGRSNTNICFGLNKSYFVRWKTKLLKLTTLLDFLDTIGFLALSPIRLTLVMW